MKLFFILFLLTLFFCPNLNAKDWPTWGGGLGKNMVSPEKSLPHDMVPGELRNDVDEIDMTTTKKLKWVVKLGNQTYGTPVVAGGKIYVGTNNKYPRQKKYKGDRSVLMCFSENTGEFLWQLAVPKLKTGKDEDWEYVGICSSPAVKNNRLYVISNRCEVLCLDTEGMKNGNDGPFKDEENYLSEKGKTKIKLDSFDGDIIWKYDMRKELGVSPHNITSSSVLLYKDQIWAVTSNGMDESHLNIANQSAPCLIVLDRKTGKLLAKEESGISERTFHCNWSSPSFGKIGEKELVFFGGGDGFLYAFNAKLNAKSQKLEEVFRIDCNPKHYRKKDGKEVEYMEYEGPSEIIGTPVVVNKKVYVSIGQDPEHGSGLGHLVCIDPNGAKGPRLVWGNTQFKRSISTVAVHEGLVYATDYSGYVYAIDEKTGETIWKHDSDSHIWSSPLVADGKVFVSNEDGQLQILKTGKTKKQLAAMDFESSIHCGIVAANEVLLVTSMQFLYAFSNKKSK